MYEYIVFVYLVVLSPFLGSFLGVVIDRVYRGEQFFKGRSYCESCKHPLGFKDLIPLFSYIALRGKCRYCKAHVPVKLALIELSAMFYFPLLFLYWWMNIYSAQEIFGSALIGLFLLLAASLLFVTSWTDLLYYVIPDVYLYGMAGIFLLLGLVAYFGGLLSFAPIADFFLPLHSHVYAGLLMGLFFAILHYGSKGKAMGEGDIYLASILGFYMGLERGIVMWFVSFLTGAVVGLILLIIGRKKIGQAIPFGPFLILGAIVAYLVGYNLFSWYLNLLLF